ncbi:MAG: ferrochelatase [Chromatiales bacterium 21-64-14]|nr:MAG: ferrochelatase [Chromatiales bacterium 21-64-14]HQU16356.1 ferrochelatase [Gammaproteobacteria bacterium]
MSTFQGEADYVHGSPARTGVLVSNLGTPDAATPAALRRYLSEFLSDPRVVELPRGLWLPLLHGVIAPLRGRHAARLYRRVWTPEGSPLLAIARRQAQALETELAARLPGPVPVALGMRYGNPALPTALDMLRRAGVRRLLLLPLYPQYSATTTASTFDAVAAVLGTWRWMPELRTIMSYHDEPGYITALAKSVRHHWAQHGEAERLMFSFHGLPRRNLTAGDPYHCQCHKTARLVAEALALPPERWQVTFQSRFGRAEWLQPYTDHTLRAWARQGVKSVEVLCPGFSADCLETLDEIAELNRRWFLEAGGATFHYIPALNDQPSHVRMLADLVTRHLQGWPDTDPGDDPEGQTAGRETARRAQALGAPR